MIRYNVQPGSKFSKSAIFPTINSKYFDPFGLKRAQEFYAEHRGKFFYTRLVSGMSTGQVEALVLFAPNAVQKWRELMVTAIVSNNLTIRDRPTSTKQSRIQIQFEESSLCRTRRM